MTGGPINMGEPYPLDDDRVEMFIPATRDTILPYEETREALEDEEPEDDS